MAMRTLKMYFYGLLLLLFVVFVIQNYSTLTYSVSLRLNLWLINLESVPLPFFLIVPMIFFAGLLLATLIGWGERRRLNRELKQLKSGRMPAETETVSSGEAAPARPKAEEAEAPQPDSKTPESS
jgi:uncharacterized integral membrane protein